MSKSNLTGKTRLYTLTSKVPNEKLDLLLVMLLEEKLHKTIAYELNLSPSTIAKFRKVFIQKRLLGE